MSLNSPKVKKWIKEHQEKYCWINFGYVGPAMDTEYFGKEIKELIKKKDLAKLYFEKSKELAKTRREQNKLEAELGFSELIRKRFFIVRDQTYYKEYRKEVLFHAFYACELVQKELAKRWQVPLKAFSYILPQEYKKERVEKLYQERKKLVVYYLDND